MASLNEVRIGGVTVLAIPAAARGRVAGREFDRTATATRAMIEAAGGYWTAFEVDLPAYAKKAIRDPMVDHEFLSDGIVDWLNRRRGWRLVERKTVRGRLAIHETVLVLPDANIADKFRREWSTFLQSSLIAFHERRRASRVRTVADLWQHLIEAKPEKRYKFAKMYVQAERAYRRSVGKLRHLRQNRKASDGLVRPSSSG